jgi:Uma2 family endonuclease
VPYACNMPGRQLVSEEEYLHTSYKPDCEYVDGEVVERNAAELGHSKLQRLLIFYFCRKQKLWQIHVFPEIRIQLRAGLYRIPDIAIFAGQEPEEQVPTTPPLIWIENLSPDDRPLRINRKVRELLECGVPYVWVIDPETLESEVHTQQGSSILEDGILRVPGTPIEVPLHALEAQP